MKYNGIELELPAAKPQMTHSVSLDMITGKSSTQNMDWTDSLGNIPFSLVREAFPDRYEEACKLFSLMNMDYQVCNGGIDQYFLNFYHEANAPHHKDDVDHYDLETQKEALTELVQFARTVFPERIEEYHALEKAAKAFEALELEENAVLYETIYCDEDEYIIDEETGEEIENPDYFEPYEEPYNEDVIHGAEGFDETFYDVTEYLEELFELRAQYICKDLAREVEKQARQHPMLFNHMHHEMPAVFRKPSLDSKIRDAAVRSAAAATPEQAPAMEPAQNNHDSK